jgi:hypothetical protein
MKFKDVPIGTEIGVADYFMTKVTNNGASFSGDYHLIDPEFEVSVEEDEDDFLSGVTCNPDAPEECESCQ